MPIPIPLIGLAVSATQGIIKNIRGRKREKAASEQIQNYQRQELKNAYEGVSAYNEAARRMAVDRINRNLGATASALAQGGARSMGVLAGAQSQANQAALQQAAQEQQAYIDLEQQKAIDDARIRQMEERREEQDLAGLGQELDYARAERGDGSDMLFGALATGLGYFGEDISDSISGLFNKAQDPYNPIAQIEPPRSQRVTTLPTSTNLPDIKK